MDEKKSPPAKPKAPTFNPVDDLYGEPGKPVDTDLDLDKGKFSEPPKKP